MLPKKPNNFHTIFKSLGDMIRSFKCFVTLWEGLEMFKNGDVPLSRKRRQKQANAGESHFVAEEKMTENQNNGEERGIRKREDFR